MELYQPKMSYSFFSYNVLIEAKLELNATYMLYSK